MLGTGAFGFHHSTDSFKPLIRASRINAYITRITFLKAGLRDCMEAEAMFQLNLLNHVELLMDVGFIVDVFFMTVFILQCSACIF